MNQSLTVRGSGFVEGAIVRVNTEALPTTFVNSNTLTTILPPSRLASPAILNITVINPTGAASTPLSFTVIPAVPPSITFFTPVLGVPGTTATGQITGSNLIGASISFAGSDVVATVLPGGSNTSLSFSLVIAPFAALGERIVTVSNASGSTTQCNASGATCLFTIIQGGRWTRTEPLRELRNRSTATLLLDGRVLVTGGEVDGTYSRSAEIYNPASNTWALTAPMSLPRADHAAALLPNGRVLVAGGLATGASMLSSAEIYDPETERWSATNFMTRAAFSRHGRATLLSDGRVLIPGFRQIYDPVAGTFSDAGGIGPSATVLADGRVIVLGTTATYVFDPVTGVWEQVTRVANGNTDSAVILLSDGRVLGRAVSESARGPDRSTDSGIYELGTDTRRPSSLRASGVLQLLADGRVLVAGDLAGPLSGGTFSVRATTYLYDASTDLVVPASPMSAARHEPIAVTLRDGRILVVGTGYPYSRITDLEAPEYAEIFTPPIAGNPAPGVETVVASTATSESPTVVTLRGANFLPSTAVRLADRSLLTVYMGSRRITAFVPPSLRALLLTSPITLTNPSPGGGSIETRVGVNTPLITSVTPNAAPAGITIDAVLAGGNLSNVLRVTVDGAGVNVAIQPGGSASSIPVSIAIAADAPAGPRTLTIFNSDGSSFRAERLFTVQPARPIVQTTPPLRIPVVEEGAIKTGYVVIRPASGSAPLASLTYGMVSDGVVQSKAGVLPTPLTTDASMVVEYVNAIRRDLGIAMVNPGNQSSQITLTVRDENGSVAASAMVSLEARRQVSRYVSEFFNNGILGEAFRGSLRLQSSIPFAVVGLRFAGSEFSTVPVGTNTVSGSTSIVLPQFALGGGWATQIALVNTSAATIIGEVNVFDPAGNPLSVALNGLLRSSFLYSIPAGGTFILAPRDANGQSPF
ncbi:MAG: hypothetical protein HY646_16635 [Acidobacteria bacterium]|nr:hypothetical protein [Acidobacteriota bacterium]